MSENNGKVKTMNEVLIKYPDNDKNLVDIDDVSRGVVPISKILESKSKKTLSDLVDGCDTYKSIRKVILHAIVDNKPVVDYRIDTKDIRLFTVQTQNIEKSGLVYQLQIEVNTDLSKAITLIKNMDGLTVHMLAVLPQKNMTKIIEHQKTQFEKTYRYSFGYKFEQLPIHIKDVYEDMEYYIRVSNITTNPYDINNIHIANLPPKKCGEILDVNIENQGVIYCEIQSFLFQENPLTQQQKESNEAKQNSNHNSTPPNTVEIKKEDGKEEDLK